MSDLKNMEVLRGGSNAFFEKLTGNASAKKYAKGHIVFIHEEDAAHFYYIKSGWVKLFRETLDGAQSVVDILPAGHIFGETPMFEDGVYPYSAEVVEPAEIIALPLSVLKNELEQNGVLAMNMLMQMIRHKRAQDRELEHMIVQNAPQRIGCFLLRLADQNTAGPITIHLPYDKTLLAARLGMQPETFSRALAKLKEKTGIKVKGATVEMDSLNQLISYSCAACSSEFPCNDLACAQK